tara:strand:- start:242 stop:448 length:207 start_codon:yes stop_codon:yes gene_type:complete
MILQAPANKTKKISNMFFFTMICPARPVSDIRFTISKYAAAFWVISTMNRTGEGESVRKLYPLYAKIF